MDRKSVVSIITVCLNSQKHIRQTIESVLNQTYINIEYIIIDGGSTDCTLDIIKEYEPKFNGRLKWVSEKDDGIYNAMNKGIKLASGDLVGIINSDDWYENDAVEIIIAEYEKNQDIGFFYGNLLVVDEDELVSVSIPKKDLRNYSCNQWMPLGHPTAFVKNNVYSKFGGFNTKYKIAADHEFILRCATKGIQFKYIDKGMAFFREGGLCQNHFEALKESVAIRIEYGAKPLNTWISYYKTILKVNIYKKFKKNKLFSKAYTIYTDKN